MLRCDKYLIENKVLKTRLKQSDEIFTEWIREVLENVVSSELSTFYVKGKIISYPGPNPHQQWSIFVTFV